MPRKNGNKLFVKGRCRDQHQRYKGKGAASRGARTLSKLIKYKHYSFEADKREKQCNKIMESFLKGEHL
jgi:hypothetical protein